MVNINRMIRKPIVWCLTFIIPLSIFLANAGNVEAGTASPTFGQPVDLGSPIQQISIFDSAYNQVDGKDYLYTTVSGKPAMFNVINLNTYEIVQSLPLTDSEQVWVHEADSYGNVYIGSTSNYLYRYDSATGVLEELGMPIPEKEQIWSMTIDEKGNVYGGTYPGGKVFKYDPVLKQFTNFGSAVEGQKYVRSLAYYDGYVYAGTGTTGHLIKIDPNDGSKKEIPLKELPGVTDYPYVYNLDVAGHYLFTHLSGGSINKLIVYDLVKGQWLDVVIEGFNGVQVSPEMNNKVYFLQNQKLVSFDLTTHEIADTGIKQTMSMKDAGWVGSDAQGKKLASIQYNGIVTMMQPDKGVREELYPIVEGQSAPLHTLEKGPDGNLYMSAYPSANGARFNPITKTTELFYMDQAESMGVFGDKLYVGIYPKAQIYELDPSKPLVKDSNPVYKFSIGEGQDRPYVTATGEGKVFFGTVPQYGELGGALVIYDPLSVTSVTYEQPATVTSVTYSVYRNVVQDQSIVGLAYRDGKVYGSTSIHGGLGIDPSATEAKMFVWDLASGTKLLEATPKLSSARKAPTMISGLTFGPDGLLWAAADGILFAVDPETLTVVKEKAVYPDVQNYGMWKPVHLRWGNDGLLYTDLNSKITVLNVNTMEVVYFGPSTGYMTLGDDGHIYYTEGTRLKMIPVRSSGSEVSTDVNGDGVVNLLDVVMVAQHVGSPITETSAYLDINGDGTINIADVGLVAMTMMER
ncbi:dockerin type I domain-containing protein [Paenibacillus marinisediminis]